MLAQAIRKPDTERYIQGEETEGEYMHGLYCSAESLITGALAITERGMEENEDLDAVYELLSAFKAVMETGERALRGKRRKKAPRVTVEQFKELIGDVGGAEVEIRVNRDGHVCSERYHVGKKYRLVDGAFKEEA